jgi:KRAB domain-containing zinc finger protein
MKGCDKKIATEKKSLIVYHKNTHFPKYACTQCDQIFPQKNRLEVHVRTAHTGEKPYTCEDCGKSFPQLSNLNDHVKKSHLYHESDASPIPGEDPGAQLTGIFTG